MTIKTLDRQSLRTLRTKMQTALDAISEETGLGIQVGRATYERDGSACTFKLNIVAPDASGEVLTADAKAFKDNAWRWDMAPEDLGRKFTYNGKVLTIVGATPRSPKYPILGQDSRGKVCKYSGGMVKTMLLPE